jgi:hypothetical protein
MRNSDVPKRADLIPHADTRDRINATHPAGTPTGMFAGETEQDRRNEAATREVLEQALPGEPGSWKQSGAVPESDVASAPPARRASGAQSS